MAESRAAVTPAGVRDGEPEILRALCARRGTSVLAYCREVCSTEQAVLAAADGFAHFRAEVSATDQPADLLPDALLLSCARHAAAARAARPATPRPTLAARLTGRRPSLRACQLMPELLVAQVEGVLSAHDEENLHRHLAHCAACREAAGRADAAEEAYCHPPTGALTAETQRAFLHALAAPAPVAAAEPLLPGDLGDRHGPSVVAIAPWVSTGRPVAARRRARSGLAAVPVIGLLWRGGVPQPRARTTGPYDTAELFSPRDPGAGLGWGLAVPGVLIAGALAGAIAVAGVFDRPSTGGPPAAANAAALSAAVAPRAQASDPKPTSHHHRHRHRAHHHHASAAVHVGHTGATSGRVSTAYVLSPPPPDARAASAGPGPPAIH